MLELVERDIAVAGRTLSLLVPTDAEALLDEDAFAHDEFLPYWAELWPSGLALAEAVSGVGGRVLELGCGLGIPSLVAALGGAEVIATDWAQDAVDLLGRNAQRVGARVRALRWRWTDPAPAQAELVIAADVLYERRNGPQLLAALDAVVAPGGEVWIADPGREAAAAFFAAAADRWDVAELRPRLWRLTASA